MARICAGPASGCDARALPLPWCRRPSSLPYSYLQRLAELLVARRCCCHPTAAVGARPPDREPTFRRACYRVGPAPCASGVSSPRSAAPLRPSRAARRRDGCRGGDCVIVCLCIVCGATRAMRATRARGASTEPVECRKCSRHHWSHLADAVAHELEDAGHRWKHRDEHDKLHRLLVDVLNVPSRAQRASAGSPIGHVMAASKSIASAQLVEEAAAIVLVHRHQCQNTCWSTLRALGRPNAAVCLLAVPFDALCCWCDCCACAAAKPLPEPRDVLIRHAGRCRMQGGAVGIGRAGRGRTECRHWTEDRGFVVVVLLLLTTQLTTPPTRRDTGRCARHP